MRCKCGVTHTYTHHLYKHITRMAGRPTMCPQCFNARGKWHSSWGGRNATIHASTRFGRELAALRVQLAVRATLARRELQRRAAARRLRCAAPQLPSLNPNAKEFTPSPPPPPPPRLMPNTSHATEPPKMTQLDVPGMQQHWNEHVLP